MEMTVSAPQTSATNAPRSGWRTALARALLFTTPLFVGLPVVMAIEGPHALPLGAQRAILVLMAPGVLWHTAIHPHAWCGNYETGDIRIWVWYAASWATWTLLLLGAAWAWRAWRGPSSSRTDWQSREDSNPRPAD